MADRKKFVIDDEAVYDKALDSLLESDPANAETVFNPLFQKMISNTHAVKIGAENAVAEAGKTANWSTISGKPSAFEPVAHGHTKAEIRDFPASIPPSGTAGGDLQGSYPNPTMGAETIGGKAPAFALAGSRSNLVSGDTIKTVFGKLMKWFADLKAVAFSGSYNDLTNKPTSMPANGGTAANVPWTGVTGKPAAFPANGGYADNAGNANALGGLQASTFASIAYVDERIVNNNNATGNLNEFRQNYTLTNGDLSYDYTSHFRGGTIELKAFSGHRTELGPTEIFISDGSYSIAPSTPGGLTISGKSIVLYDRNKKKTVTIDYRGVTVT